MPTPTPADLDYPNLHGETLSVTYRARGRSRRVWEARFDLGDFQQNARAALEIAWKMDANIISSGVA